MPAKRSATDAKCQRCGASIVRVERHETTHVWERNRDGRWTAGSSDPGVRFEVFCENNHVGKLWPRALGELSGVVFPSAEAQA